MPNIIEVRDLSVSYGVNEAVHGVNLDIAEGKITAIIGSNGAGKSTIINAISGAVKRKGSILYEGKPLTDKANRAVKQGIVQVPEGRKIFAGLTVEENLMAGAHTVSNRREVHRLLEEQYRIFPRLEERKKQDAGTLSGGEQQMLAICRGLMAKPKVLLLDEPSLGLAPIIVSDVFSNIQRIRDEGITVILVEQNANKSLAVCDYAYVIENGRVVAQGTGKELLASDEIAEAYLGRRCELSDDKDEKTMQLLKTQIEGLPVFVYENRADMGRAAAAEAAEAIREAIAKNGAANVIFAAAPSQSDLLDALLEQDIDWTKVRGFHQDEYIGLDPEHPAGFGNFMKRYIFDKAPFKELYFMQCPPDKAEEKCAEYAALLKEFPPDLIFLGVGENGHLAFNDPAVADFEDPCVIKVVELDDVCRNQQVNDGCFAELDQVPKQALTLTMSLILSVPRAIAVVPTERKAAAIRRALNGEISTECPASALRRHPGASLYLDRDSAGKAFDL